MQHVTPIRGSRLVTKSPVYYGWVILLIGSLGMVMSSPGQTYSISIFIEYFIVDLGISRSLVSTLYTAGTLTASFAMPFIGRQLDRRGSRFMLTVVSFAFGIACIYMGFVQNALMLGAGFVALRMLGQGSMGLVSKNVINQWWVRRRGLAMGIAGMALALLGSGGFPSLINNFIPTYGWRLTFGLLGLLLLVVMLPLAYLLVRNTPEAYGLQPDGYRRKINGTAEPAPTTELNWTLQEALRTPAFWLLALGLASTSMLGTGLVFHIVSIFADSGLSATMAASVFMPIAITAAIVNLASGVLVDRIPVRVLLALALILEGGTLLIAPFLYTISLAIAFGLMMGIKGGIQATVSSVAWAQYFGRLHLGSISGTVTTILVASSAFGPMLFGVARDMLGSYTLVLVISALLPVLLAVANLLYAKPPVKEAQ